MCGLAMIAIGRTAGNNKNLFEATLNVLIVIFFLNFFLSIVHFCNLYYNKLINFKLDILDVKNILDRELK